MCVDSGWGDGFDFERVWFGGDVGVDCWFCVGYYLLFFGIVDGVNDVEFVGFCVWYVVGVDGLCYWWCV